MRHPNESRLAYADRLLASHAQALAADERASRLHARLTYALAIAIPASIVAALALAAILP